MDNNDIYFINRQVQYFMEYGNMDCSEVEAFLKLDYEDQSSDKMYAETAIIEFLAKKNYFEMKTWMFDYALDQYYGTNKIKNITDKQ